MTKRLLKGARVVDPANGRDGTFDVLVLGDGSLLISDDGAGKIWRVTYSTAR